MATKYRPNPVNNESRHADDEEKRELRHTTVSNSRHAAYFGHPLRPLIFKMASKMAAKIVNDENGVFSGSSFFMHSLFLLIFVSNETNAYIIHYKITSNLVGINSFKI